MTYTAFVHEHFRQVVFLAYAALAWIIANYLSPNDPYISVEGPRPKLTRSWFSWVAIRSLLASGLAFAASGRSISIGLYVLLFTSCFSLLRSRITPRFHAEMEVIGNLAYFTGLIILARERCLNPKIWGVGRFEPGHVAAVLLIVSVVLYVEVGGTNVVRGLLEKGRILPQISPSSHSNKISRPTASAEEPEAISLQASASASSQTANTSDTVSTAERWVDEDEYNHGKLIGNAERLLLLALVAIQAYQALAFLMTAKGLFRAKELESRTFSEYFLVGTLVSSGVAVAAGLCIQMIVKLCW